MSRLRIFYDFEAFSDQSRGGITRYVLELAKRISAEADICVYAGVHRSLALRELSAPWVLGCYFPPLPRTSSLRRGLNAVLSRRAIARFRPDVVHRTYYRFAPQYLKAPRQVVTLYDFTYFHFPSLFPGGEALRIRMRRAAERAHHVICISRRTRDDAVDLLGIPESKTSVVRLGVDQLPVTTAPTPCPQPYVLYVGQRGGYKNFSLLVRALASEPSLSKLNLLAFGDRPFSADEVSLIARSGLTARIRWSHGGDDLLAAAYSSAVALVYPSLYEGFGLPLLEAMAHGCPVICSDRGSLPEVAGDAGLLFDPDSVESLRQAIRTTAVSAIARQDLRDKGLARAKQFSWDACAAATLRIYRAVDASS